MNKKILFNNNWEFSKNNEPFNNVDIPHDWLIYNTKDLYEHGEGIYRKNFEISKQSKRMILTFEGVYMDSKVYVNGTLAGEWKYGYSTFNIDISKVVKIGNNEIIVKVTHKSPSGRWYSGAGIYRNIWLNTSEESYFEIDGIYVSTIPKSKELEKWDVEISTEYNTIIQGYIIHKIYKDKKEIGSSKISIDNKLENKRTNQIIKIESPNLWSSTEPNLYKLNSQLYIIKDNKEICIESITQNIGFKHIVMDPNKGFIENGKNIKLQGTCEHHDLGCLGAAVNKVAIERRLILLKQMGVNAIRTAHNMPAIELMDLADEMGFYIVSEAFDMWERPKTTYDYSRFFKEWSEKDVRSWVRRDRNHPSLIMWSIGNEIYDTHFNEHGQEITKKLMSYVKEHDPKENGQVTIGSNYMPWENARKCADIVKFAGYNYGEKYYKEHHKKFKDWIIYGSETCSVVQSRGIYHFPLKQSILADDDEQCSSLGNSSTSWGAKSTEKCIIADRDAKYSLGQFIWTGFDYIGEPTPYHTKNSYFGQIDTAGFTKDSYYIFQSEWTDYKKSPMIHIFPYWDFNPGQTIDVRVCSNAPKIELFFNGKSLGVHLIDHKKGLDLVGNWTLNYEPGELKALAYNDEGEIVAQDSKKSFDDSHKIKLTANKVDIKANGIDLVFIEITMEDINGNPVENANNRVEVTVEGSGRLIGLDNGDSTDYDEYKGTSRRLFSGKLLAVIASTLETGEIKVIVSSTGIKSNSIILNAVEIKSNNIEIENLYRRSSNQKNKRIENDLFENEIPLRKIELKSINGQQFSPEYNEKTVEVNLYPTNTTYKDIEWSIVNDAGIPSKIAEVKTSKNKVYLTAKSDGKFQLRAMSKNGRNKTSLISQLDFSINGFGEAYKNPYSFISAGLYDDSKGDIGNGNERGIATDRAGEAQVCFRNIDFGSVGSNTITIPIFALSNEVYEIGIWEGMPGEPESSLIKNVTYQKPSTWNVYQEETYNLGRVLKGVLSICFVIKNKIHVKGFYFKKLNRAFETILAKDCNNIYGDNFKIINNKIEGIGNNVTLEFDNMDFGDEGVSRISLCGHSPIDRNTIHMRFINKNSEEHRILEFDYTSNYKECTFNFERVTGKQKVVFVFLPGCNFNMDYFTFKH